MTESSRPPVEPMSDLSWARVERGLWARLDGVSTAVPAARRKRRLWIALPAVAAVAAAALLIASLRDTPTSSQPVAATTDDVPTRVVSGGSSSTITFADAHVTLDPQSAVVMSPRGVQTTMAVVERGAAWFAVEPRPGHSFVVMAGDTVVRVIGTRFRVARSEEHATVDVDRGLVDVTFRGVTTKVGAGQTWSSKQAVPPVVPVPPAPPAPSMTPKIEPEPTTKPAPTANRDDRATYERSAALEASAPDLALAGYLALARGKSRWSEIALFAAARLATDRGDARATDLLQQYLRRFPRGANADDARQLLGSKGAPR